MLNLTRQEQLVIKFLVIFFIIGSGLYFFRTRMAESRFKHQQADSTAVVRFREQAQKADSLYLRKLSEAGAKVQRRGGKINLNTASKAELMQISKVGSVTAERIIAYRNRNGQFQSIDDLKKIKGIGEKTFERIKGEITVE